MAGDRKNIPLYVALVKEEKLNKALYIKEKVVKHPKLYIKRSK